MKKSVYLRLGNSVNIVFIIISQLFLSSFLQAQVVVNENFDTYNGALPLGWSSNTISNPSLVTNRWLDKNNSLGVLCQPSPGSHSGTNHLFYNSYAASAGSQSMLVTKSYDFSSRGVNPVSCRFWMYRDNLWGFANYDSLSVWVNTSPGLAGATWLGMVPRRYLYAPAAGLNTWNLYTFSIPAAFNGASNYIIFVGTSMTGADILIDDFSIDTWPSAMSFSSTDMFSQNTSVIARGQTNGVIVGLRIVTSNSGNPLNLYRLTLNANGSTNPSGDILNAKLWYTGQSKNFKMLNGPGGSNLNQLGTPAISFAPVTSSNKIAFMNPGASPAPLVTLSNDTNYFWLTYDISPTAGYYHLVDAEFDSIVTGTTFLTTTYSSPTIASISGGRNIEAVYCFQGYPNSAYEDDIIQGVYLSGEAGTKISLGSSSAAAPVNTGAMLPGTAYPFFTWAPVSCLVSEPGYHYYASTNNQTAILKQGGIYTLKIHEGGAFPVFNCTFWANRMGAWIDYNKDVDFNDTISSGPDNYYEHLGHIMENGNIATGSTNPSCIVTGTNTFCGVLNIQFQVPGNAPTGTTRLRVIKGFYPGNSLFPACGFSGYLLLDCKDFSVTIIPACNTAGVCQWLGYTDDWDAPANWCPNVPTINDIAVVDFNTSGTSTADYHKPNIKGGVNATCKTLRIANSDTLHITSIKYNTLTGTGVLPPSTLTIADSLRINYNTGSGNGAVLVSNQKVDSMQISNGTSSFSLYSPFSTSKRNMRQQLILTAVELHNKGLIEGDVIDTLVFYINSLSSAAADSFAGFTIKVANLITPGWSFPATATSWAPTGAFTTVFGPTNLNIRTIQSTHPNALPAVTALNKGQLSLITIPNSFTWDGVSDLVIDICYVNRTFGPLPLNNVIISQTQTTGKRKFCIANNLSSSLAAALCGVAFPLPAGYGTLAYTTEYRPNITFKFHRPNSKPIIELAGDNGTPGGFWINNGTFKAGSSEVKFTGTSGNQFIGGAHPTTFADLTINQSNGTVILQKDVIVDSLLFLNNGELALNRNTLLISKSGPASVMRTNGWIKSEDAPPGNYSSMAWNIGITPGIYEFPFGINSTNYIPIKINPSGNIGVVTVATYNTSVNNSPYPVSGGPFSTSVMHMQSQATGLDISSSNVIDRFWQINKTGPASSATLTFNYKPNAAPTGEEPSAGPFNYTAQRFSQPGGLGSPAGGWANLGGNNTPGNVVVTLASDPISGPWTLSNVLNPLPVEIIQFDATLIGSKVKTYWSVASEKDNNYFQVERTTDKNEFDFIAQVNSKGNSSSFRNYEAWDNNPKMGLQYYRLKTVGLNGQEISSGLVPIEINKVSEFLIQYVYSESENRTLLVNMEYNSSLPYNIRITDVYNRLIYHRENNHGIAGENTIQLNNILYLKGVYFIILENIEAMISKKFVY